MFRKTKMLLFFIALEQKTSIKGNQFIINEKKKLKIILLYILKYICMYENMLIMHIF